MSVQEIVWKYGPAMIGAVLLLVCAFYALRWRSGRPAVLGAAVLAVAAVAELVLFSQYPSSNEPGNVASGLGWIFMSLGCSAVMFVAGTSVVAFLLSRWSLARRSAPRAE